MDENMVWDIPREFTQFVLLFTVGDLTQRDK